jgi:hypothetical protein
MKRLPTALMAVAMTLMFATSTFAEDGWSSNFLLKPNAEVELDDEWQVWKGGFSRLSSYNSIFPHQGNFLFRLAGTVKLTQDINVSDYTSLIDNGNAEVKIGSWFRLGGGAPDCSFTIQYYDENATYLTEDSETIGCDVAKWTEQQTVKTVPPGTRTITFEIRVIVPTECEGGSYWDIFTKKYCDVLLDDAYFHINSASTFALDEIPADDDDETSSDKDDTPGSNIVDDSGDSPNDETSTKVNEVKATGVQEGIDQVKDNPSDYDLFTQAKVNEAKTTGIQEATDGRVRPQTSDEIHQISITKNQ